jgi:hypothetical protein
MPVMKERIESVEDEFWTERRELFTMQFPAYCREPQQVHGRIHASDERYFDGSHEIIPLNGQGFADAGSGENQRSGRKEIS